MSGFFYPIKGGFFFITHPSLWKHLIKSLCVSILLFLAIGALATKQYSLHIADFPFLKRVVLSGVLIFVAAVIFFAFNSILTARFMKALSRNVEEIVLKKEVKEPQIGLAKTIANMLGSIKSIPFLLFIVVLNFVPVIGQIITFYFLGRNYTSFSLERRATKNKIQVTKNTFHFIAFGIVATIMMIPPFTIIAHPICVIGGTIMTLEKIDHPT